MHPRIPPRIPGTTRDGSAARRRLREPAEVRRRTRARCAPTTTAPDRDDAGARRSRCRPTGGRAVPRAIGDDPRPGRAAWRAPGVRCGCAEAATRGPQVISRSHAARCAIPRTGSGCRAIDVSAGRSRPPATGCPAPEEQEVLPAAGWLPHHGHRAPACPRLRRGPGAGGRRLPWGSRTRLPVNHRRFGAPPPVTSGRTTADAPRPPRRPSTPGAGSEGASRWSAGETPGCPSDR